MNATIGRSDAGAEAEAHRKGERSKRSEASGPSGEDPSALYSREELARAADAPFQGGPDSAAGRALRKHAPANRPNSPYPTPIGPPITVNWVARQIVNEVLANPRTAIYVYKGRYIHAWPPAPDRRIVRWNLDGTFEAFLEKSRTTSR